jgi:flavin-dependent dehydrogenase
MNFDIAIIGASSSGLYAAELLARAGKHVALFERQDEHNPARRTYIITPQMGRLLGWVPGSAVLHRIGQMEVETARQQIRVPLREPDLIVERSLLSAAMHRRVRGAGAEVYSGYRFQGFRDGAGSTGLIFKDPAGQHKPVSARAVIGADGVFSQVARAAGLTAPPHVPIVQAEIELPNNWDPDVTKVWFDADQTRFFYWLIPESPARAVVGLVGAAESRTRMLLQKFMRRHGFRALAFQAGQVAMHHPRLRPCGRVGSLPVYLVGDAAGQVKVTTVGGTVTGLWGAQAAVNSLLTGTSYATQLRPLKRELDLHWFIRLLLERLDNPGYDQLLRFVSPAVQNLLGQHNRDEMLSVFWKFPFLQPRFLWFGLKLLLSRSYQPHPTPLRDQLQKAKS